MTLLHRTQRAGTPTWWCSGCGTIKRAKDDPKIPRQCDPDPQASPRVMIDIRNGTLVIHARTRTDLKAVQRLVHLLNLSEKPQIRLIPLSDDLYATVPNEQLAAISVAAPTAVAEKKVVVICPDCGQVTVVADVFDNGIPISGICPDCDMRLYFA